MLAEAVSSRWINKSLTEEHSTAANDYNDCFFYFTIIDFDFLEYFINICEIYLLISTKNSDRSDCI